MPSIQSVFDLSRDAINICVFVMAAIVAMRFRSIAFNSLAMLRRGRLHELPTIDWFLCGIWWSALVLGINQISGVLILRLVHDASARRILFDINDHLMIGAIVAFTVALTSSRRLVAGYAAAKRLLIRLVLLMVLIYCAVVVAGLILRAPPHLADQHSQGAQK